MPRYLILRKSGVHRAACFALYRALLRQTHELKLNEHHRHLFRKPIQAVFKRNSKLQNQVQVSTALHLGYETLEGLHDDARQQRILNRIFELAARPKSNARLEDFPSLPRTKTVRVHKTPKIKAAPYPGAPRTLDRPFRNLSGRRHVPILVNANRVPFLRLKKPQSPFLSRIIRDIVKTRERRIRREATLACEIPITEDEDQWDQLLLEQFGPHLQDPSTKGWQHEVKQAYDENRQSQNKAIQKRADVSAKMYAIVEQERALAKEERRKIETEKRRARYVRRQAKKGLTEPEIQEESHLQTEKSVTHDAPFTAKEVPKQGQGETRQPFNEEEWRKRTHKYKTPEELKQLYEASLQPRTDEEIAKIKEARAKRKEEEAERRAQKLKRKQEKAALSELEVNKWAGDSTNKRLGADEQEDLNEDAPLLKPSVHPGARRMGKQPQESQRSRVRDTKGWDQPGVQNSGIFRQSLFIRNLEDTQ